MSNRISRVLTTLLAMHGLLAAAAFAEEPPRPEEHDPHRRHMEEMALLEVQGRLGPEQAREINRYWSTHLRRSGLNPIESAHYSIAEIHLSQGNVKQAIAALSKLLDAEPSDAVKSLTHLNLAEVHRRQLSDAKKALEHYKQVGGPLRHRAQAYMTAMLVQMGRADEAAKVTRQLIADAKDKGEKLTLLQRLAALYEKAKMPDQALAAYKRIIKEFTPKDFEEIRQAAAAQARAAVARIHQLRQADNHEEAERTERSLHQRIRELHMAGRWDEARAFERAAQQAFRELFRPPQPPDEPPTDQERPRRKPGRRPDGEF